MMLMLNTGVEEGDDDNKWVTKTLMIAHEQSAHKASAPAAQFAGAAAAVLQGIFLNSSWGGFGVLTTILTAPASTCSYAPL